MADVADLVDEAVVDRMVMTAEMETGSRAEADAAVQKRVVVSAHVDAGLA